MSGVTGSLLDLNKRWYERPLPLRACSLKEVANSTVSKDEMDAMLSEAREALDAETALSQTDKGRWYSSQFISRGTTADKIASAAVKLSDVDFMFFLDGFDLLFDTARRDTHHYEAALKALSVVWPKLLPQRPLKRFVSQFFATLPTDERSRKTVLVYWYIEDYLKRTYAQFLSLAEAMLKDRLQKRREAWLDVVGKLMCSVAEGRHVGMALIVDKLGDPTSRVPHKAYHHLLALLQESSTHQSMLFVELEKVIFMNNAPVNTMKYAANVMNQFVYSKDERKLALKSVQTYLSLFRQLVVKASIDLSVTTAILVGLRRAFPYAGTDIAPLEEHLNALFVLANTGNFMQRVATLSLLQLIANGKSATEEFQNRWYRALYNLLLISPKQLSHSAQMTGFFSMLHKAMHTDKNEERIAAFAHRLIQRSLYFSESVVCAILLLVGEMFRARPRLRERLLGTRKRGGVAVVEEERYDMKHREPQYARATNESVWILGLLVRHSHPSVVKLAVMLMFNEDIVFDSHPLDELTLPNFLTMFVDAKVQPKGEEMTTGVSVFSRVVHSPNIPSASDPYFINASAQQVDVSALFLHRYAVQRQRFIDGLSQMRSTWGDVSGEADVALRVKDVDASLFGPSGLLAETAPPTSTSSTMADGSGKEGEGKKKKKSNKEKRKSEKAVELDEDVPSDDNDEHDTVAIDDDDDGFDMVGSDGDLEWGSSDDAAYDELGNDDDDDEDYSDDGDVALGGKTASGDADGGDLAELLDANRRGPSKKRQRAEQWLDRATAAAPPSYPPRQFRRR